MSDEDLDKAITAVTKAASSDAMDDFADPDIDADIDNDDMTNDDMHSVSRQSMRSASVDVSFLSFFSFSLAVSIVCCPQIIFLYCQFCYTMSISQRNTMFHPKL